MAHMAAYGFNRNNRRSGSSGSSTPSRKDQYLALIADDLQRGDAANFSTHTSQFYSELGSDTPREKLDSEISRLRPMMHAILHSNVAMVDTLLKEFPGTYQVDGTFVGPNFNNQFDKRIPNFPPELEGKTYRGVADIAIKKSSDPAKVERFKQIKKLLLRSGAKPKTHFGKLVFPEDQADVDFYKSSRPKVAGRKAKTYKRKVSKTIRSTRRRRSIGV
jgi:hypothetical protein